MVERTPAAKRRLRNYLLDPPFQLRFTALVMLLAFSGTCIIGLFLLRAQRAVASEATTAVEARGAAAEARRELGNAALGKELLQRFHDPAFEAALQARSRAIDDIYAGEHAAVVEQRAALAREQARLRWLVLASLLAFALGVFAVSIVATHKIAGPVYRIRRLLEQLSAGDRKFPAHALRSGDELQALYGSAAELVRTLRSDDEASLKAVAAALEPAERAGVAPATLGELRALHRRLLDRLGGPEAALSPPPAPRR